MFVVFHEPQRIIGGASVFIGNFFGVYLKQEVKCVEIKCLGQVAEEQREESGFLFMSHFREK